MTVAPYIFTPKEADNIQIAICNAFHKEGGFCAVIGEFIKIKEKEDEIIFKIRIKKLGNERKLGNKRCLIIGKIISHSLKEEIAIDLAQERQKEEFIFKAPVKTIEILPESGECIIQLTKDGHGFSSKTYNKLVMRKSIDRIYLTNKAQPGKYLSMLID